MPEKVSKSELTLREWTLFLEWNRTICSFLWHAFCQPCVLVVLSPRRINSTNRLIRLPLENYFKVRGDQAQSLCGTSYLIPDLALISFRALIYKCHQSAIMACQWLSRKSATTLVFVCWIKLHKENWGGGDHHFLPKTKYKIQYTSVNIKMLQDFSAYPWHTGLWDTFRQVYLNTKSVLSFVRLSVCRLCYFCRAYNL